MGNSGKLVSVIIPAYNVESYVERCLVSILNQTYKNIEVIVVDDGSTDNTGGVCQKIASTDSRIIYIRKENEGQGIARNVAMKAASGEYVTYIDSDDWCADTYIEKMVCSMEKYQTCICVCGKDGIKLNEAGEIISRKKIEQWVKPEECLEVESNKDLIYRIKFSLCAKMFKRSLFVDNNIEQPNHKFENNTVMPMLVSKAKYISMIDEELYYYWMNRSGSTINRLDSYKDMIKCLRSVKNYFEQENIMDDYYDAFYGFCKWNVNHTIARVSSVIDDNDEKEQICEELSQFMYETFKDKTYWLDKMAVVWGSYNLKRTIRLLMPGRNINKTYSFSNIVSLMDGVAKVDREKHDNEYRERMLVQDIEKEFVNNEELIKEIDVLFIDLLEERYMPCKVNDKYVTDSEIFRKCICEEYETVKRDKEYWLNWKNSCREFCNWLMRHINSDRIILVKYYLAQEYGGYKNLNQYENIEEIKEINKWLEEAYSYFQECCQGCIVVDVPNEYCYTDEDFEYGCRPHHLNYLIYDEVAKDIAEIEVI